MVRPFVIISLLLLAQVSHAQVEPSVPEISSLNLIDARPPIQNKGGFESLNIMRCSYSSMRITDKGYGFDRIQSLREVLSSNFPELAGKTISVKNYVSHLNTYVSSKRLASQLTGTQVGGAIGGAITASALKSARVIGCGPDNLTGGYIAGEVPVEISPIVTIIDLEVDGHPFHFRSISETEKPVGFGKQKGVWERNYSRARNQAMERLIPAFASFLASTPAQR